MNEKMRNSIKEDIEKCRVALTGRTSKSLFEVLYAKYHILDKSIDDSIPRYAHSMGDSNYNHELNALMAILETYLLCDSIPANTYGEQLTESKKQVQHLNRQSLGTKTNKERVEDFIRRGEKIVEEEYHPAEDGYPFSYVDGPQCDQWMNEIKTFSTRHLSKHPLYNDIQKLLTNYKRISSAYEDMMSYLQTIVNDEEFWKMSELMEAKNMYDVFISHASKDKLDYVDELKQSIDKLGINVFYDKDTIEWGDYWKNKILEGVEKAEFAIIVISENFFGREWTELELDEFLHRQNTSGQKIILPILYNITDEQLKEKYPAVADIQGLKSIEHSCDEIALLFAGQLIKRLKA